MINDFAPELPNDENHIQCEGHCGMRILRGDVKHMDDGKDVCEYCAESYD